jgi:hypothetical protein
MPRDSGGGSAGTPFVGWTQLALVALAGANAKIDSGVFAAQKALMFRIHALTGRGIGNIEIQFNGDSGANYAYVYLDNTATPGTATGTTFILALPGASANQADIEGTISSYDSASEKLVLILSALMNGAGAGNAPIGYTVWGKWANTTSLITSIQAISNVGTLPIGSTIEVWGSQ